MTLKAFKMGLILNSRRFSFPSVGMERRPQEGSKKDYNQCNGYTINYSLS